ncbi:uracil phosphoribosyltransferase [Entomoplasma ellychniae]|uniref:Uracil phosphoribosyltransferase n=2 Tax=Entomoplasmataceae TaxID=33925 RepID=A0A2S5RH06_9MOLU|nr:MULTISPECIES: uracil phosphoribosyltransferase [Entomoplasmataceae]PPE04883.1 uracil phosphoribosyltransferase [Entomoplasma ellychniae]PPE06578.1 uracil phosphoribosyltransferase [Mesoplasma corruscae]
MAFTELKHPLIIDKLTRMRKIETSSKDFRQNLNEIAQLMVYEIFRDIKLVPIQIQTPMVETTGYTVDKPIVLVPILRAGIGMLDGIQTLIPTAKVAHIGLYRDEETLEIHQYFAKKTENIQDSYVIIVDPMLATGGSAIKAIDIVKSWGVKEIKFVCLVAVEYGIDRVLEKHADVEIYAASKDKELNEKGYIVPGLGDAGDRIFGTK